MEDERGSKRRKCGLLALLLVGGGSVLLTAIAVTAGVTSSSSSSETGELNGTEQFTTEFAPTVQDFTTTRPILPTTNHQTVNTTTISSSASATTLRHNASTTHNMDNFDTTDYSYVHASTKQDSTGQEEEATTDGATGQDMHTTAATGHLTSVNDSNGWGHDTTAVLLEEVTTLPTGALSNSSGNSTNSCGDSTIIDNSFITYDLRPYQQAIVTFVCGKGYELVGNGTRICGNDGIWHGDVPFCDVVKCSHPESIENGDTVIKNGTEFGARVSYVCREGYDLQGGSPVIDCLDNGEWRKLNATCNPVSCGEPTGVDHGHVNFSDGTFYGSEAVYRCDEGHYLQGNVTRQCGPDKLWSGTSPVCQSVSCGEPTGVDHGHVNFSDGTFYGSEAVYRCDEGHYLQGNVTRQCGPDKLWSGTSPVCQLINCGEPQQLINGYAVYSSTSYGSDGRYYCNEGHRSSNTSSNMTLYCGDGGIWEGDSSTCEIVSCGPPREINNGYPVYNDTVYLSELMYNCHEGYLIDNDYVRLCGLDGYWHGNQAYCIASIECSRLGGIDNGGVRVYGQSYGSQSDYTCQTEYVMVGNSSRICGRDGTWSGSEPECISSVLFYCNYGVDVYTNCGENFDSIWVVYASYGVKGFYLTGGDQTPEMITPALAKYTGEACLVLHYLLGVGNADIIVQSDSMGSFGRKLKILGPCYGEVRNFSMTLDLVADDKVLLSVSSTAGYQGELLFGIRTISITAGRCDVDGKYTRPTFKGTGSINLEGSIQSPDYPKKYTNRLDEQWDISVPSGMKIKVTFIDFELQDEDYDFLLWEWHCVDYLQIQEGGSSLLSECGNKLPGPVTSSGNSLKVILKTDGSTRRRGFHLNWQAIDCGTCGCIN